MKKKKQPKLPESSPAPPATASCPHSRRSWLIAIGVLALLTLAMFGDVLFQSTTILSSRSTDALSQYFRWREFGFSEMKAGRIALWNPACFSGSPFLGGFQPALLYPPNALFLVLPTVTAFNWSFALHIFLAGTFTCAWAARRGLHPAACVLAAAVYMFCGSNFLRVFAGHITMTCVITWTPLLFLVIDNLRERPTLGWTLTGMFALAMQILAGYPQHVFCTGVAAAAYCVLHLVRMERRAIFVGCMVAIVLGAIALSAAQLFTSFQELRESMRSGGVPYDFVRNYSFPPENLLTAWAPSLFGNMHSVPYWGRCNGWEMSLFLGAGVSALAAAGVCCGDRKTRYIAVGVAGLMFLLALGGHTPFFKLLYDTVPGFNKFRGSNKFSFIVSLFVALLAGMGFNEVLKGRRFPRLLLGGVIATGLALLIAGAAVNSSLPSPEGWWRSAMMAVKNTGERGESYMWSPGFMEPAFAVDAGKMAAASLGAGGLIMVLAGGLLWAAGRWRPATWLLLGLAVAELFVFARRSLDYFNVSELVNPTTVKFLQMKPGDYRILDVDRPNGSLSMRTSDIWGYDPNGPLLRYAELIAASQGQSPDQAVAFNNFTTDHPLLAMFRLRYMFVPHEGRLMIVPGTNDLPHVLLVQHYRLLNGRDALITALTNTAFNPREEVILESEPRPAPQLATEPGNARVVNALPGQLIIEAETKQPALLLVSDNYARGWRVEALPRSSQQHYEILPANYCLRAVPLEAGTHRLRMDYLPSGYVVGRKVSIIALILFALTAAIYTWRHHYLRITRSI